MEGVHVILALLVAALVALVLFAVYGDSTGWREDTPFPNCVEKVYHHRDFPADFHDSITLYCKKEIR